jgi:membrane-bound lytic murein transglycosylase B
MRKVLCGVGLAVLFITNSARAGDLKGWDYLVEKLLADGVPRDKVVSVFDDPRLEPFTGLYFSPERRRESHASYRGFLTPARVALARRCRAQHAEAFEAAEQAHGVPASVLAAVLFVETACGQNTGSYRIFYRLARLAMANDPANVERNIARTAQADGDVDPSVEAKLRERARSLEALFYPEVRALFTLADRDGIDPLALRGSPSGAFGYPQFLPTSFLQHGIDGDGDGQVSLYDPADAAASCAHYFAGRGWHPGVGSAERRALVWEYNHSTAYVDTILALAAYIEAPDTPVQTRSAKRGKASRTKNAAHKGARRKPVRRTRGR